MCHQSQIEFAGPTEEYVQKCITSFCKLSKYTLWGRFSFCALWDTLLNAFADHRYKSFLEPNDFKTKRQRGPVHFSEHLQQLCRSWQEQQRWEEEEGGAWRSASGPGCSLLLLLLLLLLLQSPKLASCFENRALSQNQITITRFRHKFSSYSFRNVYPLSVSINLSKISQF